MTLDYDIAVIGGGPSGIAAAVSARRFGARVLIVERDGVLGGMSTAGLLNIWCGNADSEFFTRLGEVTSLTEKKQRVFSPEKLKNVYIDELERVGADVLLHSIPCGATVDNGRVESVTLLCGAERTELKASVFIDSTGNGDLAAMAGARYAKGRPEDGLMQPLSVEFMLCGVDETRAVYPTIGSSPELEKKIREYVADGRINEPAGHIILIKGVEPSTVFANMTHVIKADGTSAADMTRAELEARRQIPQLARFIRECVPGYENSFVAASAQYAGVRETRHFEGEYTLTEEDILASRVFNDRIVRNAQYGFGIHTITRGMNTDGTSESKYLKYHGEKYTIPYRCFLPRSLDNLLLNGRCISGTHTAHGSFRIMPICFAMGEGVGCAAALATRDGLPLRGLLDGGKMKELQTLLFGGE